MTSEPTPVYCDCCSRDTFVLPNGDCPTCGRLITVFPGAHMPLSQPRTTMTQQQLVDFIADRSKQVLRYSREGERILAAYWAERLAHNVKFLNDEGRGLRPTPTTEPGDPILTRDGKPPCQ